MQAYDQLHPLPLVEMVLNVDSQQMDLGDEEAFVVQQHTQTNALAESDANFDRFLDCWPPLAPHQQPVRAYASYAASVASTDDELSE